MTSANKSTNTKSKEDGQISSGTFSMRFANNGSGYGINGSGFDTISLQQAVADAIQRHV
jgi:hypothetical protein